MSTQPLGEYNPADFESVLYAEWMEKGYFKSGVNLSKQPYTIVIPPPNVTGMLHMGHVLNNTIQDVLIRYKRMDGFEACWVPGTDHASIATEAKVAKMLQENGLNKFEIGRDKFLEYAQEWKEKYGGIIISQLKKLGCSCDWDRERFTMDDGYYKAVIHSFVELYKKGFIYKGFRLVNWCPVSKSAISDEEVYFEEVDGHLWYFKYPVKGEDAYLEVATTRPETMLGDTAVAVNPKDKRYKKFVGKTVVLPIVGREIPVIADDYVDPEFGTGCVKITPAHDPNDYEMAKRHDLQIVNILNPDASLNDSVPEEFRGLDRYEAREAVVEKMRELKMLSKIDKYTNKVGYSERGHVPIEPMLSEQWYMRMDELIKPAHKAVKDGKVAIYPERWTKVYFNWLDNIRDWCISRQLWWGHRIPVYYCDECGFYDAYETAPEKCGKCGSTKIRQDEDVLDTWASSWLWPFAVHKWPLVDDELKYYYPTDTLVTAPDIIFFWVARMIIAGYEFMGQIPFNKVYFTSLVRDELGRKMSKSLGNSPDPLDVIAEFGADALRYTIIRLAPMGNDILYSNEKCRLGREFANKVWNASKFILNAIDGVKIKEVGKVDLDDFDKWILTRYNETVTKTRTEIDEFRFNEAAITLYDFIWGEFCAWYIEASKVAIYDGSAADKESKAATLLHVLEGSLKLLHPFMPFVTEKIFRALPGTPETIMRSDFPKADSHYQFDKERDEIAWAQEAVYTVRNIRGENNIPPHIAVKVRIIVDDPKKSAALKRNETVVKKLAKIESLDILNEAKKTDIEVAGIGKGFECYISLEGIIDVAKEKERIAKEIERVRGSIERARAKLDNKEFVSKAPEAVIAKEKEKLQQFEVELEKFEKNLRALGD